MTATSSAGLLPEAADQTLAPGVFVGGSDPSCDYDVVPADWRPGSGYPDSGMVQDNVRLSDWVNAFLSEGGRYTNPLTGLVTTFANVE